MDQVTWLLKRLSHAFVTQFVKVGGWFFYVMISLQLGGYDQVGKEALNRLTWISHSTSASTALRL
jgi:hypothetical protein